MLCVWHRHGVLARVGQASKVTTFLSGAGQGRVLLSDVWGPERRLLGRLVLEVVVWERMKLSGKVGSFNAQAKSFQGRSVCSKTSLNINLARYRM